MSDVVNWWAELKRATQEREDAVAARVQAIVKTKNVNKVVVHRYICPKPDCGVVGTVMKLGDDIYMRTRDYKFSPGLNAARSVETARAKNTLDGNRHWPGHDFDVQELAAWGPTAGMDLNCRHQTSTVLAIDVLATVADTKPGKPGKPTLLPLGSASV